MIRHTEIKVTPLDNYLLSVVFDILPEKSTKAISNHFDS